MTLTTACDSSPSWMTFSATTNATWHSWCDSSDATVTNQTIWSTGGSDSSGTIDSSSNAIWHSWSSWSSFKFKPVVVEVDLTELERLKDLREQQRLRRVEEAAERQRVRQAAKAKAKDLLEGCLSEKQLAMFREMGCFLVISQNGRLYRIEEGAVQNVFELDRQDQEKVIARLCAGPQNVPKHDVVLAQKLMLENAEDAFREIANIDFRFRFWIG